MGQQQLLLLVLSVVLVALAVVVGIQSFQEYKRKAAQGQAVVEAARLATLMIAWKQTVRRGARRQHLGPPPP